MIIKHKHKADYFTIDTDGKDPVMIIGLLKSKIHEMYEIIIDGDTLIVHKVPCIEI